jgi:MFS family permease
MCFGLMLTGLSLSLLSVPIIPEIINASVESLNIEESPVLYDKASAISLAGQSLGYIFGPIVGGILYDWHGFRGTTDILMLICFGLTLIYYLFILWPLKEGDRQ